MYPSSVVEVNLVAALPTSGGCAIFLGDQKKVFVIYVDQTVGSAINMLLRDIPRERPQTHDLLSSVLDGLGARLSRVVINDYKEGVYYARIILEAENELSNKKIVEIDARPSDSLALALEQNAQIYVSTEVWDNAEDMSDVLKSLQSEDIEFED